MPLLRLPSEYPAREQFELVCFALYRPSFVGEGRCFKVKAEAVYSAGDWVKEAGAHLSQQVAIGGSPLSVLSGLLLSLYL